MGVGELGITVEVSVGVGDGTGVMGVAVGELKEAVGVLKGVGDSVGVVVEVVSTDMAEPRRACSGSVMLGGSVDVAVKKPGGIGETTRASTKGVEETGV